MNGTCVDPERAVATIFNSAVAATAISTAWEVGLLSELKTNRKINAESFALKHVAISIANTGTQHFGAPWRGWISTSRLLLISDAVAAGGSCRYNITGGILEIFKFIRLETDELSRF